MPSKAVAKEGMCAGDTEQCKQLKLLLSSTSIEALLYVDACAVAVSISVCARLPLFACLSIGCVMRPLPVTSASVKERLGSQVYLWGE